MAESPRYGTLLFHPCPLATRTTGERIANHPVHFGGGFNRAFEDGVLSGSRFFHIPAEHNLIPFQCAGALGFGDWPVVGEGDAEFLVFLLFIVAVHSQSTLPPNGLTTVPVILIADSIGRLN